MIGLISHNPGTGNTMPVNGSENTPETHQIVTGTMWLQLTAEIVSEADELAAGFRGRTTIPDTEQSFP